MADALGVGSNRRPVAGVGAAFLVLGAFVELYRILRELTRRRITREQARKPLLRRGLRDPSHCANRGRSCVAWRWIAGVAQ
jgi:hypothetical protein